jgi:hypothetical protein
MLYTPTVFYLPESPSSDELLREIRGRGLEKFFDYYDISTEGARGIPDCINIVPSVCTYDEVYGGDSAIEYLRTLTPEKPVLLKLDIPVDNCLFMTVVRGHLDIIKTLIVSGASVNACNYRGQTPLHFAVAYDNIEIVQLLTEFGADYFAKDNDGYMPIDYAKFYQSQNVLDFVNDHSLIEIEDQEVKIRRELHPNNNLIVDYFNEDD